MVAALAKALQIPVIVAAESYKFSEKVQLDSIVHNELGHPSEIAVIGAAGTIDTHSSGRVHTEFSVCVFHYFPFSCELIFDPFCFRCSYRGQLQRGPGACAPETVGLPRSRHLGCGI